MKFLIFNFLLVLFTFDFLVIKANVITIYDNHFADTREQAIFVLKAIDRHSAKRVNTNETTNKGDCADPSDYDLQYQLDLHNEMIMQLLARALHLTSFDSNTEEYEISEALASQSDLDSSDCDKIKLSSFRLRSVCPYVVAIVEREDRFPRAISKLMCSCEYCRSMNNQPLSPGLYGCSPKYIKKTYLYRGECKNGTYEWLVGEEMIPSACGCKLKRKIRLFRQEDELEN